MPSSQTGVSGKLVIVSGPSGAGKTTVVKRLFGECPVPLAKSVSATTRPPREGEIDGDNYHFLSLAEFQQKREAGEFLECFEVFGRGIWYGTLRSEVEDGFRGHKSVLLEIDVHGMQQAVKHYPNAITIFVRPRTFEELERRLRGRGTESEEAIQRRLEVARQEWEWAPRYKFQVINDSIDEAVKELCRLLQSEIAK